MELDASDSLWDFAVRTYGLPGVDEACLRLQDEQGIDVPVLLFALWLAEKNIAMTDDDLAAIDGRVSAWREQVIRPLRSVSRHLKSGLYPTPSKETEEIRQAVKAAELKAEKLELAVLEAEGRAISARPEKVEDVYRSNVLAVVRHYSGCEPGTAAMPAIEALLQAVRR